MFLQAVLPESRDVKSSLSSMNNNRNYVLDSDSAADGAFRDGAICDSPARRHASGEITVRMFGDI